MSECEHGKQHAGVCGGCGQVLTATADEEAALIGERDKFKEHVDKLQYRLAHEHMLQFVPDERDTRAALRFVISCLERHGVELFSDLNRDQIKKEIDRVFIALEQERDTVRAALAEREDQLYRVEDRAIRQQEMIVALEQERDELDESYMRVTDNLMDAEQRINVLTQERDAARAELAALAGDVHDALSELAAGWPHDDESLGAWLVNETGNEDLRCLPARLSAAWERRPDAGQEKTLPRLARENPERLRIVLDAENALGDRWASSAADVENAGCTGTVPRCTSSCPMFGCVYWRPRPDAGQEE